GGGGGRGGGWGGGGGGGWRSGAGKIGSCRLRYRCDVARKTGDRRSVCGRGDSRLMIAGGARDRRVGRARVLAGCGQRRVAGERAALTVALEPELIRALVLRRQGRGYRLRHIRAATWQRVGKERSAVAVARKMPGRINRVVPDEFDRVSARSVRYGKRRDVGA